MSNLAPVIRAGMRGHWRSWAFSVPFLVMALTFVAAIDVLGVVFFLQPAVQAPDPNLPRPPQVLGVMLYTISLMGMGLGLNIFTAQPLIREKSQRILESLLATPLTVRELWLAKALAIYLPGLILTEALVASSLVAVGGWLLAHGAGLPLNVWSLLSGFLAVPVLYLALCLLVLLVGLMGNPISGNIIAQVALPGLAATMINLAARDVLRCNGWPFLAIHLGIAVVLGAIVLALLPRLTRERVVVSSRS